CRPRTPRSWGGRREHADALRRGAGAAVRALRHSSAPGCRRPRLARGLYQGFRQGLRQDEASGGAEGGPPQGDRQDVPLAAGAGGNLSHGMTARDEMAVSKVGLLVGREWSWPPRFIEEVSRRGAGVVAEHAKLGGTRMDEPVPYAVIIDRISHEVPYYR